MGIFKHLLLPVCALSLLAGCAGNPGASSAVARQNQAPAAADEVATSKDDGSQEVTCDTEMETGSHVHKHTVCMSQQDRDAQERAMSTLGAHGGGPASH